LKNEKLRELLNKPGIILAPGVYDAIGAKLVEKAGFDVCYMTGNGSVASYLGKPDIGLATMSEMVVRAHNIASAIHIPLISDADTGYGNLNNVKRTVEEFEAAGVSGIHLEDQITPKKCGAMEGLSLIPQDEAVEKIKVALSARKDDNFLIIARTDSKAVYGLDEAIRRAKAFADAGADLVYVEMLENKEEILKVTSSINNAPVLYDVVELSRRITYSAKELENLGVKVAIYALSATLYVAKKLGQFFETLKKDGTTLSFFDEMLPLHDYEKLMGLDEELNIRDLAK
jgi:2-methylisocitrate lyase-like PEP mutase family enzyme